MAVTHLLSPTKPNKNSTGQNLSPTNKMVAICPHNLDYTLQILIRISYNPCPTCLSQIPTNLMNTKLVPTNLKDTNLRLVPINPKGINPRSTNNHHQGLTLKRPTPTSHNMDLTLRNPILTNQGLILTSLNTVMM